jgi:flavodoxin
MNILVLYHSRNGHTRKVAEAITQTTQNLHHETIVKSVSQVHASDIEAADMLFIGTWVQGFILFGVKPAGASLWVPALPSLKGKAVGLFCTYVFSPLDSLRTLETLLEARGATILGQHAFHRRHLYNGVEPFAQRIIQLAEHTLN